MGLVINLHVVVQPLFQLINEFKKALLSDRTSGSWFDVFKEKVTSCESSMKEIGIFEIDRDDVLYAIVSLIDEIAMKTNWSGQLAWISQPLQQVYFHEHTAGRGFFKRLERLMEKDEVKIPVLSIYYQCLLLGFLGKYHMESPSARQDILQKLAEKIFSNYANRDVLLYLSHSKKDHVSIKRNYSISKYILILCIILLCFVYAGFSIAINNEGKEASAKLSAIDMFTQEGMYQ